MMEQDFDDTALRRLRRYVRMVSQALDLHGESSYVQADELASAYIALDGHLSRFPDHDVALLWDENQGWWVGVENHGPEDLPAVAHLRQEPFPPPETVAAWTKSLLLVEHTTPWSTMESPPVPMP